MKTMIVTGVICALFFSGAYLFLKEEGQIVEAKNAKPKVKKPVSVPKSTKKQSEFEKIVALNKAMTRARERASFIEDCDGNIECAETLGRINDSTLALLKEAHDQGISIEHNPGDNYWFEEVYAIGSKIYIDPGADDEDFLEFFGKQ